jgi:hypothetical protein
MGVARGRRLPPAGVCPSTPMVGIFTASRSACLYTVFFCLHSPQFNCLANVGSNLLKIPKYRSFTRQAAVEV